MPFAETHVMEEKSGSSKKPIAASGALLRCAIDTGSVERLAISGWIDGGRAGPVGLESRASRPRHCPWATPPILEVRRKYEDFGPKKIRWYLETNRPELALPSRQTMHNILVRHDLVPRRDGGCAVASGSRIPTLDGRLQKPMGDGELCYPLTAGHAFKVRTGVRSFGRDDRRRDTRLFRYGLPERIRTDNGTPFASNALGRLSRLSVWFIQVGILPELIEPGCPQQNGKHENMHLVLKRRTTRPPSRPCIPGVQEPTTRLDRMNVGLPADLYRPSPRPFPKQLEPVTYPGHFDPARQHERWSDGTATAFPVGRLFAGPKSASRRLTTGGLLRTHLVRPSNPNASSSTPSDEGRDELECKGRRTVT